MEQPVPHGSDDVEDWILQYIYQHPNEVHSTHTLLKQLDSVLIAEPSKLEESNRVRGVMGSPSLTPEDYATLRKPDLHVVQRAVETLIMNGWTKGKRDADAQHIVFFDGLALTSSGERERVRRTRDKEERAKSPRGFEETVRRIHQSREGKTKESE